MRIVNQHDSFTTVAISYLQSSIEEDKWVKRSHGQNGGWYFTYPDNEMNDRIKLNFIGNRGSGQYIVALKSYYHPEQPITKLEVTMDEFMQLVTLVDPPQKSLPITVRPMYNAILELTIKE